MSKAITDVLRLDASHNTNWNLDAAAVAVFNHASSSHDRLAYCWGLASRLEDIAHFLSLHPDSDLQRMASLMQTHVSPLVAVLDFMACETVPGRA